MHLSFRFLSLVALSLTLAVSASSSPGDLDPTFGIGGVARGHFARNSFDETVASALQPDGKVIVAGFTASNHFDLTAESSNLLLSRFNTDGSLDTAFGFNGLATKSSRI